MIGIQRAITRTSGIAKRNPGSTRGLRRRAFAGGAAATALAMVTAGIALAAATAGDSVIHACYRADEGAASALRVVASAEDCKKNETHLAWNQAGPTGPAGPQGLTGPAGERGPAGQGLQGMVIERTTSGAITLPAGVTRAIVELWGAGGTGGCPNSFYDFYTRRQFRTTGSGGGGGAYARFGIDVAPGEAFTFETGVPTGGCGSSAPTTALKRADGTVIASITGGAGGGEATFPCYTSGSTRFCTVEEPLATAGGVVSTAPSGALTRAGRPGAAGSWCSSPCTLEPAAGGAAWHGSVEPLGGYGSDGGLGYSASPRVGGTVIVSW